MELYDQARGNCIKGYCVTHNKTEQRLMFQMHEEKSYMIKKFNMHVITIVTRLALTLRQSLDRLLYLKTKEKENNDKEELAVLFIN